MSCYKYELLIPWSCLLQHALVSHSMQPDCKDWINATCFRFQALIRWHPVFLCIMYFSYFFLIKSQKKIVFFFFWLKITISALFFKQKDEKNYLKKASLKHFRPWKLQLWTIFKLSTRFLLCYFREEMLVSNCSTINPHFIWN